MSDAEDIEIPKRKKGVKNPQSYKRNVIKNARLHGQSYTSYSGKDVPSIEFKAHCPYVLMSLVCCFLN